MDLGDYIKFICNTYTSEQINMCDYCFYISNIRRCYYRQCIKENQYLQYCDDCI